LKPFLEPFDKELAKNDIEVESQGESQLKQRRFTLGVPMTDPLGKI